jgi:hypothetical protein
MRASGIFAVLLVGALVSGPLWAGTISEREFIDESEFVELPEDVLDAIRKIVAQGGDAAHPLVSYLYEPNLVVSEDGVVIKASFVNERAAYRNSLGYFVYEVRGDGTIRILERQLIFPDCSRTDEGGKLNPGDTSILRDSGGNPRIFDAGTRIGFFIIASGWASDTVQNWDPESATFPSEDPSTNAGPARGTYTTLNRLNREFAEGYEDLSRHVVVIQLTEDGAPGDGFLGAGGLFLMGFEDLHRGVNSDEDFDDTIFIVSSEPATAPD